MSFKAFNTENKFVDISIQEFKDIYGDMSNIEKPNRLFNIAQYERYIRNDNDFYQITSKYLDACDKGSNEALREVYYYLTEEVDRGEGIKYLAKYFGQEKFRTQDNYNSLAFYHLRNNNYVYSIELYFESYDKFKNTCIFTNLKDNIRGLKICSPELHRRVDINKKLQENIVKHIKEMNFEYDSEVRKELIQILYLIDYKFDKKFCSKYKLIDDIIEVERVLPAMNIIIH